MRFRTGALGCALGLLLIVAGASRASAYIAITGYTTGSTSAAHASLTLPVPASAAAGEVLVAQVAARGGSRNQFIAPSGWILARCADADGADGVLIGQAIYYHIATSAEPASYTWNFSSAGPNSAAGAIAAYTGVDLNQPIDAGRTIGDASLTDSTITAPFLFVPPNHSTDHVLCFYAIANSSFITTPGPHRRYSFGASSGGISVAMSEQVLTRGGNTTDYPATATSARPNIGAQIALLPAGAPVASVWPLFHNDLQHTGLSPIDTSASTGTKKWQFSIAVADEDGTGLAPALGADGTIYVGSDDDNLYAVRPDGTLKWKFATGGSLHSPVVGADGTVYVGSNDDNLYAVKPDGSFKWKFTAGFEITRPATVAPDGSIYFGSSDTNIYALNPNGTQKWKFQTESFVDCSPAIGWDGTIYEGGDDHYLYAFTPSGALKWKFLTDDVVASSAAVGADGVIYVGTGDAFFGGSGPHHMYALNPDGSLKWKFLAGSFIRSAPAVGADGTIYFGSDDGKLYALNRNGESKWEFATGGPVASSPALGADGTVYDASEDHSLYAINPDGSLKWQFAIGNGTDASPVLGADASIYLDANDNLYAIH